MNNITYLICDVMFYLADNDEASSDGDAVDGKAGRGGRGGLDGWGGHRGDAFNVDPCD